MADHLATLPEHTDRLALAVDSLDLVRVLTLADPALTIGALELTVHSWDRPHPRWTGTLKQVPHVTSYSVAYPEEPPGDATVSLSLRKPVPLATVARGIYTLLGLDRQRHGYGQIELGTAELPPGALALLPTRTAPGLPTPPTRHLNGVGLSNADLGLIGTPELFDEMRANADVPELTVSRTSLLVAPDGHLAVSERQQLPLLDLNVHNPVGRVQDYNNPVASLALSVLGEQLVFTATPFTDHLGRVDPDSEEYAGWSRPAAQPVSDLEVARLHDVEQIDLSGLHAADATSETVLYHRLAELAATGAVLHSLPASFTRADDILGKRLADLLRAPYKASRGLARELRSVPQRREAMQRFGGFFELAGHAADLGHRLLPTVSVVLPTMRPSRVADVVNALAAQRYPHVETAIALHGVDEAPGDEFEAAVRAAGASVHTYDRSTPFGSVLADLARRTTGDLVLKIDDDDVYGPLVIDDLVLAYLYSGAEVVGKTTEYLYFEDIDHTAHRRFATEQYHYQVAGGAMLLSRATLNEIGGWRPTPNSTDRSVLIRVGNGGGIGYRTHGLGYVYIRHTDGHTWKRDDSLLVAGAFEQWPRFVDEIVEA